MTRAPRRWVQLGLQARPGTRGGRRRGAGRPKGRTTVERTARPRLSGREVLHVTLKLLPGAPGLRRHRVHDVVRRSMRLANRRGDFRLCQYSLQSNHLHLVCEADSTASLSRGMQGLSISVARQVNWLAGRRGRFFADRYHLEVLEKPLQVRNVLRYVLRNSVRHGVHPPGPLVDIFSSAQSFDGWKERRLLPVIDGDAPAVVAARTWLLSQGWRRHGPISIDELPAAARARQGR